jgi:hypothetical protein
MASRFPTLPNVSGFFGLESEGSLADCILSVIDVVLGCGSSGMSVFDDS